MSSDLLLPISFESVKLLELSSVIDTLSDWGTGTRLEVWNHQFRPSTPKSFTIPNRCVSSAVKNPLDNEGYPLAVRVDQVASAT